MLICSRRTGQHFKILAKSIGPRGIWDGLRGCPVCLESKTNLLNSWAVSYGLPGRFSVCITMEILEPKGYFDHLGLACLPIYEHLLSSFFYFFYFYFFYLVRALAREGSIFGVFVASVVERRLIEVRVVIVGPI